MDAQVKLLTGPLLVSEPTVLGGSQGFMLMIFAATMLLTAALYAGVKDNPPKAAPKETSATSTPSTAEPETKAIALPTDLLFEYGKAELTPAADERLRQVAGKLRAQRVWKITVIGHTDDRGSPVFNQKLSERRASAVYAWLIGAGCFDPTGVKAKGYGATEQVAPNIRQDGSDYPEGRARNRRVELRYEVPAKGEGKSLPIEPCLPRE